MISSVFKVFPFIAFWVSCLILPHYQVQLGFWESTLDFLIIVLLFISTFMILNSRLNQNLFLKFGLTLLSLGGFGLGVVFLALGISIPYQVWSRFGAGTMELNGSVFIFGDLAHLTSAAGCSKPIITGTDVCDPWGRLFNQNSEVGKLFHLLDFTNVEFVGIFSLLGFTASFFFAIRYLKVSSLSPYVVLLTPALVLAIDRGNELITLNFILIGLYSLRTDSRVLQTLSALALSSAAFFKLWPIFLIFFLLLFQWSRIRLTPRVLLILTFVYWASKFHEIETILKVTQSGLPFGTSFGIGLFASTQLNSVQIYLLLSITLGITFLLIKLGDHHLREFTNSALGIRAMRWISPLALTYCAVWITGDSYIYRMVILFPIVLILSEKRIFDFTWSKFALSATLVTLISSRLPITIAISSALALYFAYVVFKAWQVRTSTLHRSPRGLRS